MELTQLTKKIMMQSHHDIFTDTPEASVTVTVVKLLTTFFRSVNNCLLKAGRAQYR